MTARRPQVDLRREPEDVLGPWVAEEDIAGGEADVRDPRVHLSFTAHDPRLAVVAEAIGARWAMWLESDLPAPPAVEIEAEHILEHLDAWARDQLAATGMPTTGFTIVALLSKLSRTQAALHAAVQAFRGPWPSATTRDPGAVLVSTPVAAATVAQWEQIATGEIGPTPTGPSE